MSIDQVCKIYIHHQMLNKVFFCKSFTSMMQKINLHVFNLLVVVLQMCYVMFCQHALCHSLFDSLRSKRLVHQYMSKFSKEHYFRLLLRSLIFYLVIYLFLHKDIHQSFCYIRKYFNKGTLIEYLPRVFYFIFIIEFLKYIHREKNGLIKDITESFHLRFD